MDCQSDVFALKTQMAPQDIHLFKGLEWMTDIWDLTSFRGGLYCNLFRIRQFYYSIAEEKGI